MDASKAQSFGRHVFLSPHLDDVVLSCGGTVARLAQQRESVLVVTVFGGDPDLDRLSSFAQETHAAWGDPPTPYATRRAEDRAGVARLGATPLHLGFQDAIYRRDAAGVPIYTSNEVLFGPPRATDGALVDRLETVLRSLVCRLGPTALYIPLAVGRHVDHQLVARAAWRLLAPPSTAPELWWYEDFPYAAGGFPEHAPDTVSAALARWSEGTWRSREMAIDPAVKIEAIDCYASQVPMLFEDGEAMEQAVRDYSASLSTEVAHAERYWQPE